MKIALCQMEIAWEDKEKNYLRVEEKLKKAYEREIGLFLLPEMSFTGFSMNVNVTKENDYKTVNRMIQYAGKFDMAVGFGWVKDCGEKAENHYTVVSKKGEILSDYVKIHPFSYSEEDKHFQGGKRVVAFQMEEMSFSSFICYDIRFPEIFQAASKKAHVILVPANWPEARSEHWKCLLRARAIENQVYIMAVNCVGEMNGLKYSGDSCIIDPDGKVLMELAGEEGILEYDLENNVQKFRDKFPVKKDRREELYNELYFKQ